MGKDLQGLSSTYHSCTDRSSAVVDNESLKAVGSQSEEKGYDLSEGTPTLDNGPISCLTEDNPAGGETWASGRSLGTLWL